MSGGMFPGWRPTGIYKRLKALETQMKDVLKRLKDLEEQPKP